MDSQKTYYDVIVVGGGPAGLTFAQRALAAQKSVLLLESNGAIGGCHRVERTQGNLNLFTEHGPRVYSSAYRTFKDILHDIGLDFNALFTRYDIQISNIGGRTLRSMRLKEWIPFAYAFFLLTFNPDYGSDVTMEQFARQYHFSHGTREYIDRLCRMTDGASASRYTLNEFLNLMNQQSLYSLYQPKAPNDTGLFKVWVSALIQRGLHLKLHTPVTHLSRGGDLLTVNGKYTAKHVILAIPPTSLVRLLQGIPDPYIKNNFGDIARLSRFATRTEYIQYIPITFHWNTKLQLPKIWGFPASDWGVAFIVLSDYFFNEPEKEQERTLISAAITYQDRPSSALGKTAAQCSRSELISETFRQLCESYPPGTDIPPPTKSIISPDVHYSAQESQYRNSNSAYIYSPGSGSVGSASLPPFGIYVPNLFTLGTHNNESKYRFTSLESAVQNAVHLSNELYSYSPGQMLMLKGPVMLTDLLFPVLCSLFVILIIFIFFVNFKVQWRGDYLPSRLQS